MRYIWTTPKHHFSEVRTARLKRLLLNSRIMGELRQQKISLQKLKNCCTKNQQKITHYKMKRKNNQIGIKYIKDEFSMT